jgi:putative thioredoxin
VATEVTDFAKDVLERSRTTPVVVDFWAEWCGPCKTLGPILELLESKSQGRWVLVKVDTDRNQETAVRYGIRGIPNVKLFVDGVPAAEFTGALPERAVEQWLEKNLPDPRRGDIEQVRSLIAQGDREAAVLLLERLLVETPAHEEARVLLACLVVFNAPSRAQELVADLDASSPFWLQVDAVRTATEMIGKAKDGAALPEGPTAPAYRAALGLVAAQDFEGALRSFIDIIRSDRYYDDDGSRKACIALFKLLGDDHPLTRAYRREFSSALY